MRRIALMAMFIPFLIVFAFWGVAALYRQDVFESSEIRTFKHHIKTALKEGKEEINLSEILPFEVKRICAASFYQSFYPKIKPTYFPPDDSFWLLILEKMNGQLVPVKMWNSENYFKYIYQDDCYQGNSIGLIHIGYPDDNIHCRKVDGYGGCVKLVNLENQNRNIVP
jgi:hypothetical protein